MDAKILEQHMLADEKFQEEMRMYQRTVATKDDIAGIFKTEIEAYFKNKGKLTFSIIIGTSILVTAFVALFGGIKTILAWIGFSYLSK